MCVLALVLRSNFGEYLVLTLDAKLQAQFLTIVGSVGGNSAIRANKVFSKGLEWSNFALMDREDGGSAGTRRSVQDALKGVSSSMCGSSEWDAVVIDFLARMVICAIALLLVSSLRSGLRQYLIWRYGAQGCLACFRVFGLWITMSDARDSRCFDFKSDGFCSRIQAADTA